MRARRRWRRQTAALIESYVAITAPARDAGAGSRPCSVPDKLDLGDRRSTPFRRRLDLLEAAGVRSPGATFSAEFGRDLEYYTGFVFEISRAHARAQEPDRRRRPLRQPARRRRRRGRRAGRRLVASTPSACWRC